MTTLVIILIVKRSGIFHRKLVRKFVIYYVKCHIYICTDSVLSIGKEDRLYAGFTVLYSVDKMSCHPV